MNKNTGQAARPSYGRVHISEAQKRLAEMEIEDEGGASVPRNGVSIVDIANKENRADYVYQILGSLGADLSARNSIYGPACSSSASSQAYRVKSVLPPSKRVIQPENLHTGSIATTDATKATVLSTYAPSKPCNSCKLVEDAIGNLSSTYSQPVSKGRPDASAKTLTSHNGLTGDVKPVQTPFSQKPFGYSRVPVSSQKPDFDDDDDDDDDDAAAKISKKNSVQDVPRFVEDFNSFLDSISTALNDEEDDGLVEPADAGDSNHKLVQLIGGNPPRFQCHATESTSVREPRSLSFQRDKSASASNLILKPSRQPESVCDCLERPIFETSNTAEAFHRLLPVAGLSTTGETYPRSMRNYSDYANSAALLQRPTKMPEFSSNTGEFYPRSSANRESANAVERSQQSTIVRTSQPVSSASQKLAVGINSAAIPSLTAFSHLGDVKTLVINGNAYILLRVIGQGGSSKVYKGLAPGCKDCAVKCVNFATADESMVASYRNEIRLLQQLQDNVEVVKLYDYIFDEDANMLYVVMEYGEMDLHTFFRSKESEMRILQLLVRPYWIQMLHAVRVLHRQGIVHSDLKPANFIVVRGRIKLIDFGIAKTVMPDCTSVMCDEIVGTFNYMSPEAVTDLSGGRDLDGESKPNVKISVKSDVWSLGCILYYLVYSHTPFEHIRNQLMKLQAIMNPSYKIEFPATKIPHVVDVLKRCLDRNPKNRPTIEELLDHPYITSD